MFSTLTFGENIYNMRNSYPSHCVPIEDLLYIGFAVDINLVAVCIESKSLKMKWKAGDLDVVKYYLFEGLSDPGDNTILYIIETKGGRKGLLVDVYGADQGGTSSEMIKKLSIRHD